MTNPIYSRILASRHDMTEWLIHFTRNRGKIPARETLKKILVEGALKPSFSVRNEKRTIYGDRPAVCFSEQPISFFQESLKARNEPCAMAGYGLFIHKKFVNKRKGLPVIYGLPFHIEKNEDDNRLLDESCLPIIQQYRYVVFDPSNEKDWTHEREWRWRAPTNESNFAIFEHNYLMPPVCAFVKHDSDVKWLRNEVSNALELYIEGKGEIDPVSEYDPIIVNYFSGITRAQIVSLQSVESYPRFEDLEEERLCLLLKESTIDSLKETILKTRFR